MKLLRYGPAGAEKPGLLDSTGAIRDLSAIVPDISRDTLLPESISALRKLDPSSLPRVNGTPRLGPCVGQAEVRLHRLDYSVTRESDAVPAARIVFLRHPPASCPNATSRYRAARRKPTEVGVCGTASGEYVTDQSALSYCRYASCPPLERRVPARRRRDQW